jgi:hypothetical protein
MAGCYPKIDCYCMLCSSLYFSPHAQFVGWFDLYLFLLSDKVKCRMLLVTKQ